MKTIFLTGDDTNKIDIRLQQLVSSAKSKNYNVVEIGDNSLSNLLKARDLFQAKKLLIIPKLSLLDANDIKAVEKNVGDPNIVIILLNETLAPAIKLKAFGKGIKIETYRLPKIIWSLLDSLKKGGSKKTLMLLKEATQTEAVELIFYLVGQRFVQLFLAKTKPSELKSASWQVTKLQSQAENFTEGELKQIISDLAQIDVDTKTGKNDLGSLLDFFIATKLE